MTTPDRPGRGHNGTPDLADDVAAKVIAALNSNGYRLVQASDFDDLVAALRTLVERLDGCPRFERGIGGMTIDAQIGRTILREVRASWVEDAREALDKIDSAISSGSGRGGQ